MILALILFVVTYILLLALPNHRHWVALGSAAVFLALRILPGSDDAKNPREEEETPDA